MGNDPCEEGEEEEGSTGTGTGAGAEEEGGEEEEVFPHLEETSTNATSPFAVLLISFWVRLAAHFIYTVAGARVFQHCSQCKWSSPCDPAPVPAMYIIRF